MDKVNLPYASVSGGVSNVRFHLEGIIQLERLCIQPFYIML